MRLLLIEDDIEIQHLLQQFLETEGYEVSCASDGISGEKAALGGEVDLIILDIMLPEKNGLEVLKSLRPQLRTPIIMLTAKGDDLDRIIGLEMGADDYLPKPFNPRELLARIRAIQRRIALDQQQALRLLHINGFVLDRDKMEVRINQRPIALTHSEFRVLETLSEHADHVVSKAQLTEQVLDRKLSAFDRAIDMHVSNVRRKVPDCGIETVRGVGYLLRKVADT